MHNSIGRFLVVLTFCGAGSASAALMAPVVVNGRQWLQPLDFVRLTYDVVSQTCDPSTGACSGLLDNENVDGYTWANVEDINGLFNFYLDGSGRMLGPGPDEEGFWPEIPPEVYHFFSDFEPTLDSVLFLTSGLSRDLKDPTLLPPSYAPYIPIVLIQEDSGGNFASGFSTAFDLPIGCREGQCSESEFTGVWLYKDQAPPPVPLPSTAWLFVSGLLGLVGVARRKRH